MSTNNVSSIVTGKKCADATGLWVGSCGSLATPHTWPFPKGDKRGMAFERRNSCTRGVLRTQSMGTQGERRGGERGVGRGEKNTTSKRGEELEGPNLRRRRG